MEIETKNFDEVVDLILDHIVSCNQFHSLQCCYDHKSFNQIVYCNCKKEWSVLDDIFQNLHFVNERILLLIKNGKFTKENEGVMKMLELYKKAKVDKANKDNKELQENISGKMNVLYNIDVA